MAETIAVIKQLATSACSFYIKILNTFINSNFLLSYGSYSLMNTVGSFIASSSSWIIIRSLKVILLCGYILAVPASFTTS